MVRIYVAAMLAMAIPGGAPTQTPSAPTRQIGPARRTVAFFSAVQEVAPFSAEAMAQRTAEADADDKDGVAADVALNDWKLCVLDAIARWADLRESAGTLVDGAFGRCADLQRDYRSHLQRITQDGRVIMDLQMARSMTRGLEEVWRPRLVAAALDQALAQQHAAAVK